MLFYPLVIKYYLYISLTSITHNDKYISTPQVNGRIYNGTHSAEAKELRDQLEHDWMARLNTLVPNGMNLQE